MSTSAAGRAWTSSALPGVTLIQAELGGHRFPPHIHRQYVVGVSECGRHRAWRRGEEVLLSPAHVSVVAPEEVHAAEALPGEAWSWRSFHLEPEMIAGVVAPRGGGLPATRPVREHARLAGTLLAAHRALDEGGDREVGIRLLRDALVALFAPRGRRPAGVAPSHTTPDPRVARARALLETRYRCGIALEDLARASGSSRHHLVRLFREEVGVTPYDYLIQVRVRRAQELLAAGWPIVEAAQEVGFADQSHLHRHFKRRLGVTPGAFVRG